MTTTNLPIDGLDEILKNLSALGTKIETQVIRSGLTAMANPILEEARLRTRSNRVRAALKKGSSRKNQDGTFSIRIYVDEGKKGGFLGYFEEYGVRPHLIARTGKGEGRVAIRKASEGTGTVANGVMKIGEDFVSGIIHHPGTAAHPFLRPALDVRAEDAIAAFRTKIIEVVEGKTGFRLDATLDEAA